MGVSELAATLKQPKNSVFRILTTLADYGYLDRDEEVKTYRVNRKLLTLGHTAMESGSLIELSLEPMRRLRDLTGETVLIGTLSGGQGVVLEQVASRQAVKVHVEIGHRFPLHTAAPAKAMLAFLPAAQREALIQGMAFERFTPRTITTAPAYREELQRVRDAGYALDQGEEMTDLACAAAPLWNRAGEPLTALWVTGPRSRVTDELLPAVGAAVRAAAQEIMARIGARVPREYLATAKE
jgi:IclR family acetate operon transcriptional repressor